MIIFLSWENYCAGCDCLADLHPDARLKAYWPSNGPRQKKLLKYSPIVHAHRQIPKIPRNEKESFDSKNMASEKKNTHRHENEQEDEKCGKWKTDGIRSNIVGKQAIESIEMSIKFVSVELGTCFFSQTILRMLFFFIIIVGRRRSFVCLYKCLRGRASAHPPIVLTEMAVVYVAHIIMPLL